ncbi:MAG: hypothetical protein NOOUEUKL_000182 [Candidatus Fervidibacter sp.]|mgnify:FL=1
MKRHGLTLMELLTVISIIATLAALLYPVYLKVRSRVYEVRCADQLRQIGLAIRMYAQDQGDGTPYSLVYILGRPYPYYIRDKEILVCPYFNALFPGVAEEAHQISQKIHKEPWSSYFQIIPKGLDEEAKRDYVPSFSEVFAQRGDQTPIAYCNTHRSGCPDTNNESYRLAPSYHYFAHYCSRKYPLYRPDAPVIVLRWGGSVSFVYKGGASLGTYQVLMDY